MTRPERPLELGKGRELPLVGLTVIAAADEIARLRETKAEADWCKEAKLVELEPAEPIPPELIDKATVVVIQVDQNEPRSMRRVEQIHQRRPELPQVVALSDANLSVVRTMLRQGVADVVSLPLNPDEVLQAAITSVEKQSGPARAAVVRAPLVAVVRSLGGSGATTLVTHLARQFSQVPGPEHDVCIMDLDVQFGTVADVLGLHSRRNLSDVMEAGDRLDGQFLRSIAVERQSGLSVITAPPEIMPLETFDTEQLLHAIDVARAEFDYVFLDLPSDWSNWNLSAMLEASCIIMVVEQSISSLKQAVRRIELLKSVGVPDNKITIVVNRIEKRLFGNISLSDVAETLKHDVLAGLHADWQSISAARDQGVFVDEIRPKSPYASDVAKLAAILSARLSSEGSR